MFRRKRDAFQHEDEGKTFPDGEFEMLKATLIEDMLDIGVRGEFGGVLLWLNIDISSPDI